MVMTKRVKMEDRVGQVYGRLTVESVYREGKRSYAECSCSCGNKLTSRIDALQSGATVSCGCYMKERISETHSTHGASHTRTYKIWEGMKMRCSNINSAAYVRYGKEGITYDSRWECFENFLEDMGEAPDDMSLDRIDNTFGYSKDNCRWATNTTQARNRSKRKNCKHSEHVGVYFDVRAKTGGWFFKTYKDYKSVSKYCQSEQQAAAFYNYCSQLLYDVEVTMNEVEYTLSNSDKEMLDTLVAKKFPEILTKEKSK